MTQFKIKQILISVSACLAAFFVLTILPNEVSKLFAAGSVPGAYFWTGNPSIDDAESKLDGLGVDSIRLTFSSRSNIDYGLGGCDENFSLRGFAKNSNFDSILSNPNYSTIMITAFDGVSLSNCGNTKNYLNPDFYSTENTAKIQKEYEEFAKYLSENYPNKQFIISNWEGDNDIYCGQAYGATAQSCPEAGGNLEAFTNWINARDEGIGRANASNVKTAVEFNIVRYLEGQNLPSVLHDVISSISSDYFSYSSYESINSIVQGDQGESFRQDIETIRNILAAAGKNPNSLIIGEYGFNTGSREETAANLQTIYGIIEEYNIPLSFVWNLYDAGGQFGLYDSNGAITPAGRFVCEHNGGCGMVLYLRNITDGNRNPNFWTIDSWRLELRGAPANQQVNICGIQNGNAVSCTPVAELGFGAAPTTDAGGNWALENSWSGSDDASLYGVWQEWADVGGFRSNMIAFTVNQAQLSDNGAFYIPDSFRSVNSNGDPVSLDVAGGTPPYTWSVARGSLPDGWTLTSDGQLIQENGFSLRSWINKAFAQEESGAGIRAQDSSSPPKNAVADVSARLAQAEGESSGSLQKSGFHLVPCGRSDQKDTPDASCNFRHLIFLIYRIINLLLALSGLIAVIFMFYYSFQMVTSLGEPEAISGAKHGLTRAVIGFSIILLSFVIIGVFLSILKIDCKPWSIDAWKGNSASCLKGP